jgi:signal transduction histidine kinase
VSWLRRWIGLHIDLLIALALTAVGQAEVWSGLVQGGPRLPVARAVAVGTLGVAPRRSHPITAVVVTCGSMTTQAVLGVDGNTAFAPLLAAFLAIGTAGYQSARPLVALICAVGLVWPAVLISQELPLGTDPVHVAGDMLYAAILIGLAWFVGRGFAVGRLQRALSQERSDAAAAQERLRIARDVHDIVAHSISVMALHAGGARRLLHPEQTQAIQALEVVEQTGRQALAEIGQVLSDLRSVGEPALTRASLDRAIEPLRVAGIRVRLTVDDLPEVLANEIGAAGQRVVREAVANVLRHARATAVEVTAAGDADRLRIEIVDDGVGPPVPGGRPAGHGLVGMRERVAEVGGTVRTGPASATGGFRVDATLPLAPARAR